jgi:hypothetical protein
MQPLTRFAARYPNVVERRQQLATAFLEQSVVCIHSVAVQ